MTSSINTIEWDVIFMGESIAEDYVSQQDMGQIYRQGHPPDVTYRPWSRNSILTANGVNREFFQHDNPAIVEKRFHT